MITYMDEKYVTDLKNWKN